MTSLGATLDNFKEHLNKSSGADNAELFRVLEAATSVAENDLDFGIGPIVHRTVVESVLVSGSSLILSTPPVAEMVSLTNPGGVTVDLAGVVIDKAAGVVTSASSTPLGRGYHEATYTAGRAASTDDVPADIQLAVCLIGKYLWDTQRGRAAGRAQGSAAESNNEVAGAFEMNRARKLLQPFGGWVSVH